MTTSGRYRLIRRIAAGGMAEVYRARALGPEGFEKDLCVKRVLPHFARDTEFVEMFKNEARLAAKLQHANIVQIFDFGEDEGSYFIAMELVEGRDLRGWIELARRAGERLPIGLCAFIAHEAARGLSYAHEKRDGGVPLGIVHRDISPHNLLVSYSGEVKVADFGIAKAASRAAATRSGVLKGKVAYMSPEQARGGDVDARTDIFALGVVLHELLTGKRLFQADSEAESLGRILHGSIQSPRELNDAVPQALSDLVMRMLARNRDERVESAEELARELARFLFTLPSEEATASALATWCARFDEELPAEGAARTKLASDPGAEPTSSAPVKARVAGPTDETLAREELETPPSDTMAQGATALTRSEVHGIGRWKDPRWRRIAIAVIAATVGLVVALAWWSTRGWNESSDTSPRGARESMAALSAPAPPVRAEGVAPPGDATQKPAVARIFPALDERASTEDRPEKNARKKPRAKRARGTEKVRVTREESRDLASVAAGSQRALLAGAARPRAAPLPTPPSSSERAVAPVPEPPRVKGRLLVRVIPWADVFVNGKLIADMPTAGLPFPEGTHEVRIRNTDRGHDETFKVRVVSGETRRVFREISAK